MRVNVYSQELTRELKVVAKTAADTGIPYYGLRIYLASPDILHHTPQDDDRSAITFWVPDAGRFTKHDFADLLRHAATLVEELVPDPPQFLPRLAE